MELVSADLQSAPDDPPKPDDVMLGLRPLSPAAAATATAAGEVAARAFSGTAGATWVCCIVGLNGGGGGESP